MGEVRSDGGGGFEVIVDVSELIWERIGLTLFIALLTILITWVIAIPTAVYVATHQYSFLDYLMSFISFVGLGTPGSGTALRYAAELRVSSTVTS